MKKIRSWKVSKTTLVILALVVCVGVIGTVYIAKVQAETSGSSNESGVTSRIITAYNAIVALTFGSDSAGSWGDWGAKWNRIYSAAKWVPTGNLTLVDVRPGKTFYNNSRSVQTGTGVLQGSCATETYDDNDSGGQHNCSFTWAANPSPVTGDDARSGGGSQDPGTGLTWSNLLLKTGTTIGFSVGSNTAFSWDASATANKALTAPVAGDRTAVQLCGDQGNGWRLPTQKELMLAYIDGSFWNLTQPSYYFWSATQFNSTYAWNVVLSYGNTTSNGNGTTYQLRCVR